MICCHGTPWQQVMKSHYGVIEGSQQNGQGPVHVFLNPAMGTITDTTPVFVINQKNPKTGRFDEQKVMIGFDSYKHAQKAYQTNFPKGWKGMGAIEPMPFSQLRTWVGDQRQNGKPPLAESVAPGSKPHGGRRETPSTSGRVAQADPHQRLPGPASNRLTDAGQPTAHTPQARPSTQNPNGNTAPSLTPAAQRPAPQRVPAAAQRGIFEAKIKTLLDNKRWQNLLDRLGENHAAAVRRAREGRAEESHHEQFWDGAMRHVQDSGASPAHVAEAVAAYALENYAAAPPGVRDTVANLVDTTRTWIDQHSGVPSGAVTSAQIIGLTQAALRTPKEQSSTPISSREGSIISTEQNTSNQSRHIITNSNNRAEANSPSAVARTFQGNGAYPGVDNFRDITLKKGTILYAGEPGLSGFFTTESAFRRAGTDAQAIFEGLQVKPRDGMYRPTLTKFIITQDTPAAFGIVRNNPQFGPGGLPQIYIANFSEVIQSVESYSLNSRMERLTK